MTRRRWTLDAFVFRMLLEQAERDRLPFPLQHRPTADTAADYHRQRHDAADAALAVLDDDLRIAVRTIVEPTVRVELVGHVRTSQSDNVKLRAHGAIGHDVGVVLTQKPGVDDRAGGSVTVELTDPFGVVGAVLTNLPAAERGSSPRIDVDKPTAATRESPLIQSLSRTTGDDRYQRLFSRSPSSAGEILVCAGPAADSRLAEGTRGVQWVDFADDGRYMIRHTSIISVVPVSVPDLSAEIRSILEKVTGAC